MKTAVVAWVFVVATWNLATVKLVVYSVNTFGESGCTCLYYVLPVNTVWLWKLTTVCVNFGGDLITISHG